jgi:hypothetical protein
VPQSHRTTALTGSTAANAPSNELYLALCKHKEVTSIPVQRATRRDEPHPQVLCLASSHTVTFVSILPFSPWNNIVWLPCSTITSLNLNITSTSPLPGLVYRYLIFRPIIEHDPKRSTIKFLSVQITTYDDISFLEPYYQTKKVLTSLVAIGAGRFIQCCHAYRYLPTRG